MRIAVWVMTLIYTPGDAAANLILCITKENELGFDGEVALDE